LVAGGLAMVRTSGSTDSSGANQRSGAVAARAQRGCGPGMGRIHPGPPDKMPDPASHGVRLFCAKDLFPLGFSRINAQAPAPP
jgi:hypothetical protein